MGIFGCCSCDGACGYGAGDFTADDLATAWTVSSGTWAIGSGVLTCTAPGILLFNTAHPDGASSMVVQVDLKHNTSGRACAVIVGWVDSSNYFYVNYLIGTNFIEIRKVVAGVDSSVASVAATLNTNTNYTALVCVSDSGKISCSLDGTVKLAVGSQAITGTVCGLKAQFSGTATFDNFTVTKSHGTGATACQACGSPSVPGTPSVCANCCSLSSSQLILSWPGGLTDIHCTVCSALSAGDYTLNFLGSCQWRYAPIVDETCTDGRNPITGEGTDCSAASGFAKVFILAASFIDTTATPNICSLKVDVLLSVCNGVAAVNKILAHASYVLPVGANVDLCDGEERTLDLHSEASRATSYRGVTGWWDSYSGGCGGSLPSTITIRAA